MSRVVFATDLHLNEGRDSLAAIATDLDEIAGLAPDLLVQGGDVCLWTPGAGTHLTDLLRGRPFPVVHAMGNHDTARQLPPEQLDHDFVTQLGPRNTCTDLGDAYVVTLNTCRMQPQYSDWRNVRAEAIAADLAWLDATLAALQRDRPLLFFVHIPLATTYPERRGADRDVTDVWRVTNADAVHGRLAAWPGPVVVGQGHLHENEHLHRDGVHYVSVGSVCGRWWQQGAATRCTDDAPRGWMVVEVEAGDLHLSYRAARGPAEWQGEIAYAREVPGTEPSAAGVRANGDTDLGDTTAPRSGAVGTGDTCAWLNVFFADPAETVEVHLHGAWIALPPPSPLRVDDDFVSTHHWALPPGFAEDEVRVRTRLRGRAWDVGAVRRPQTGPR